MCKSVLCTIHTTRPNSDPYNPLVHLAAQVYPVSRSPPPGGASLTANRMGQGGWESVPHTTGVGLLAMFPARAGFRGAVAASLLKVMEKLLPLSYAQKSKPLRGVCRTCVYRLFSFYVGRRFRSAGTVFLPNQARGSRRNSFKFDSMMA